MNWSLDSTYWWAKNDSCFWQRFHVFMFLIVSIEIIFQLRKNCSECLSWYVGTYTFVTNYFIRKDFLWDGRIQWWWLDSKSVLLKIVVWKNDEFTFNRQKNEKLTLCKSKALGFASTCNLVFNLSMEKLLFASGSAFLLFLFQPVSLHC